MRAWHAVLVGVGAGGLVAGLLARAKGQRLQRRAVTLQASLTGRGDALEAYLASEGDALEATLREFGEVKVRAIAERTAREILEQEYALTPTLIAQAQRVDAAARVIQRWASA